MPHFVVHCSENVLMLKSSEDILKASHDTADATRLFKKGDVKVRIQTFRHFRVGDARSDFIHIFSNIMEGKTTEQKANPSREITRVLKFMFPDIPIISINVWEFEKATYCNKNMI